MIGFLILVSWLIVVGLFYSVFRRGCCCRWGLPSCSPERWGFSYYGGVCGKQRLVTLYISFGRGMCHFKPLFFFFLFCDRYSPAFFLFLWCAEEEGDFVDGLVTVSRCLHWTLDWFGYSNRTKVCAMWLSMDHVIHSTLPSPLIGIKSLTFCLDKLLTTL